MTEEQKKNNGLLNRLIIYMGTSDDLIFWVLIDVLYLSTVKGFTDVEISMIFTGAFWGSLILSFPYFLLVKKIKIQAAMVLNQVLLLVASFMLLAFQSVVSIMAALCVYFVALDTFDIGDILVHDICRKSNGKRDFVKCRSQRSTLYGVLSLAIALLVYPLMQVNGFLPMIIGTCLTAGSLVFVIFIARDSKDMIPFAKDAPTAQGSSISAAPTAQRSSTSAAPTAQGSSISAAPSTQGSITADAPPARKLLDFKNIAYSKVTWTYIVLSIFSGSFLILFVTNGKILLNDDITMVYGAARTVAIFSGVIIATRVTKIIGNAIPQLVLKKVKKYQGSAVAVASILLVAMVLTLLSFSHPQSSVILVGISLVVVYLVFDSLYCITQYLFLNGLSEQQELSAIYIVNLARNILKAVLSSIITMLLMSGTMLGAMQLLTLVAILTLLTSVVGLYFYRRAKKH